MISILYVLSSQFVLLLKTTFVVDVSFTRSCFAISRFQKFSIGRKKVAQCRKNRTSFAQLLRKNLISPTTIKNQRFTLKTGKTVLLNRKPLKKQKKNEKRKPFSFEGRLVSTP